MVPNKFLLLEEGRAVIGRGAHMGKRIYPSCGLRVRSRVPASSAGVNHKHLLVHSHRRTMPQKFTVHQIQVRSIVPWELWGKSSEPQLKFSDDKVALRRQRKIKVSNLSRISLLQHKFILDYHETEETDTPILVDCWNIIHIRVFFHSWI